MTQQPHGDASSTPRRVPVAEAARLLGISDGAVRQRIKRGTLPSEREGGRLYVLLNIDPTGDTSRTYDRTNNHTSELIATLREQLQAERQAHAEARRLLAAALERIPLQLESPRDEQESPQAAAEDQSDTQTPSEPQEASVRPWLRRIFEG
jgi:excisionase family DNA binding protein